MKSVKEMVLVALLSAILVASKEVLSFLPNIECVSFLLMIFARHFRFNVSFMISVIFCFVEMILYGFGEWTIMYFLVWGGFVVIVYFLKNKVHSRNGCAVLSALFGLSFGFFFSLPYALLSLQAGLSYWLSGLFFDLVHGVGNFLVCMLLFDEMDGWIGRQFALLC